LRESPAGTSDRATLREHSEIRPGRSQVAELFSKKGGSTPTFQIIAEKLANFIAHGTQALIPIAEGNIQSIDLGRPHMTSEEMWAARRENGDE
jgi:hypothetical protein